jgi:hypothetical protein
LGSFAKGTLSHVVSRGAFDPAYGDLSIILELTFHLNAHMFLFCFWLVSMGTCVIAHPFLSRVLSGHVESKDDITL